MHAQVHAEINQKGQCPACLGCQALWQHSQSGWPWTGVAGGRRRNLALQWQPGFFVQAVSGTGVTQAPLTHWFQLRWVGTSRTCQGGHISWTSPSQQWRPLHQPP